MGQVTIVATTWESNETRVTRSHIFQAEDVLYIGADSKEQFNRRIVIVDSGNRVLAVWGTDYDYVIVNNAVTKTEEVLSVLQEHEKSFDADQVAAPVPSGEASVASELDPNDPGDGNYKGE